MGTRDTYQRVLLQACLIAGHERALSDALGIPLNNLVGYLLGESRMPNDVFLRAVDIVLAHTGKQIAEHQLMLEEVRRRNRQNRRRMN